MGTGVDVRVDGWDTRGHWFGVIVGAADRRAATRRDDPMANGSSRLHVALRRWLLAPNLTPAFVRPPRSVSVKSDALVTRAHAFSPSVVTLF